MSNHRAINGETLELELTYLAAVIPEAINDVQPIAMEDTYFPEDPEVHAHLRLRAKNERYEITKKTMVDDGDASAHVETTIPLETSEYLALASASMRKISKDRYRVNIDGYPAEVDVFKGVLRGLVLIDFEFQSYEEKANFTPPDVCLTDVTQEEFLAGGVLSGKSYEDIQPYLVRLGYSAL